MARCRSNKANGEQCKGTAVATHGYCWAHAPENAERRSRQASRAAKAKPNREIKDLKDELSSLTSQVLAGEVETSKVAVANQLINTRLRAVEIERKIKETEELEERLERLEESAGTQKGGRKWGA